MRQTRDRDPFLIRLKSIEGLLLPELRDHPIYLCVAHVGYVEKDKEDRDGPRPEPDVSDSVENLLCAGRDL